MSGLVFAGSAQVIALGMWATPLPVFSLILTTLVDWGLDFAFAAVFASLLVGLYRSRHDVAPWAVAAIVALVTQKAVPGMWYILLAAIAGTIVGVLRDGH